MKKTLSLLIFCLLAYFTSHSYALVEEQNAPIPVFKLQSNNEEHLEPVDLVDIEDDTEDVAYASDLLPMSDYYNSEYSDITYPSECTVNTYTYVRIWPRNNSNMPFENNYYSQFISNIKRESNLLYQYPTYHPDTSIEYEYLCPKTVKPAYLKMRYNDYFTPAIELLDISITIKPSGLRIDHSDFLVPPQFYSYRYPGMNNQIVIEPKDVFGNAITGPLDMISYRIYLHTAPHIKYENTHYVGSTHRLNIDSSLLVLPPGTYVIKVWKDYEFYSKTFMINLL